MNVIDWTATGRLLRFDLRHNRILLLLIVLLPFLLAFGTASANESVMTTPAELHQYVLESTSSPVSAGMLGPIDAESVAGVTAWRIRISSGLFAAVFSTIIIIGLTRKEEELGRLELVRAGAVGRYAPLTAALLEVFCANLLGGMLMAAGFAAAGFPLLGSCAAGLATALCGCFFAAVASAAAQITPSARTAGAIAYALLAFFIFFNVLGNFQTKLGAIFYLSPFSWGALGRPYAGENFGVFAFAAVLILLVSAGAFGLSAKRDAGAGLIPERSGRVSAKTGFDNPFALAWKLQRGSLFAWTAAYAAAGLLLGTLVTVIESIFEGNPATAGWIAGLGGKGTAFLYFMIYILVEVTSVYAITAALRLREEEVEHRAEPLLTSAVSRAKWAASHLVFSFGGTALLIAALGLGAGVTASAALHDGSQFYVIFLTTVSKIPAVWFVASITACCFGFQPKLVAGVSWALVGVFYAIEFMWELKVIGANVFQLSPFSYVYPGVAVTAVPLCVLTLLAAGLTAAGVAGLQRREIGL